MRLQPWVRWSGPRLCPGGNGFWRGAGYFARPRHRGGHRRPDAGAVGRLGRHTATRPRRRGGRPALQAVGFAAALAGAHAQPRAHGVRPLSSSVSGSVGSRGRATPPCAVAGAMAGWARAAGCT